MNIFIAALFAVTVGTVVYALLMLLKKRMPEQGGVQHLAEGDITGQGTTPEINCASCGQKVLIDRDRCPYCNTAIKSYWFQDEGETKRAILFQKNGKDFLFLDGKMLFIDQSDDIPPALKKCLEVSKNQKLNPVPIMPTRISTGSKNGFGEQRGIKPWTRRGMK